MLKNVFLFKWAKTRGDIYNKTPPANYSIARPEAENRYQQVWKPASATKPTLNPTHFKPRVGSILPYK